MPEDQQQQPQQQQQQQQQTKHEEQQHQTVIVCVDFTDESEKAVKDYIDRLHRDGNRVIIVHCINIPKKITEAKSEEDEEERDHFTKLWEEEESNLKILESKLMFLFMSHEIPASFYTIIGKPASMIWRLADVEQANLIVLGSRKAHGKKSPFRSVIGSMTGLQDGVTDSVLKNASCPVVVCRSPQPPREERRFSLFPLDRKFSVIPERQRCQSTSAVDVTHKSHKKHRHSSGGESIAARIKRRFSSGGHRQMSVPGPEFSGRLEKHSEGNEEDDSAFEPPTSNPPGASTEIEPAHMPKTQETAGATKHSVTIEANVEMCAQRLTLEDGEDEDKDGESEKCGIKMKNLQKTSISVAPPTKA